MAESFRKVIALLFCIVVVAWYSGALSVHIDINTLHVFIQTVLIGVIVKLIIATGSDFMK